MTNELKPCPFCGEYPKLTDCAYDALTIIECELCEKTRDCIVRVECALHDQAIEVWNTRAERTCHPVEKFSEDSPFPVMVCSECGRPLHYDEFREMDYQPYCGCGAKVVE